MVVTVSDDLFRLGTMWADEDLSDHESSLQYQCIKDQTSWKCSAKINLSQTAFVSGLRQRTGSGFQAGQLGSLVGQNEQQGSQV